MEYACVSKVVKRYETTGSGHPIFDRTVSYETKLEIIKSYFGCFDASAYPVKTIEEVCNKFKIDSGKVNRIIKDYKRGFVRPSKERVYEDPIG